MGQGGASIFNEVEANLFGYSVASQYAFGQGLPFGSAAPMGNTNAVGQAFESSFNELIYSNSFPKESFVSAVQTFRGGSMKNNSGIYSNTSSYPLQRSNQKTSLIKRFYPLMR